MNELIKTAQELQEWLCSLNKLNEFHLNRALNAGIYVSAKVRKEYLCSECQGRFILKGNSMQAKFENCGGGVYRVGVMK
jgi:hypothetical protein